MKNKIKVKNKIFLISLAVVLALSLSIVGCEGEGEAEFTLKFATIHPATSPFNSVVNKGWINFIEEESEGRIEIEHLMGEASGDPTQIYDQVKNGVFDIGCHMIAFSLGRWPLVEVAFLPLMFEFPGSRAAGLTVMELYDEYTEIQDGFSDVKVLGFHANGPAQIHTVDDYVQTIEDLDGLLIDTEGWGAKAIEALNATVESVGAFERYDALQKKTIDGNALEWEGQISWNLWEVTNYSVDVGLYLFIFVHVMNLDTWDSLPSDLQALFVGENAETLFTIYGYNFDKGDIAAREEIDAEYKDRGKPGIYVLPEGERDRWVDAVMPVWDEWLGVATNATGNETAHAILDDCIAFAEEFAVDPDPDVACNWCADTLHDWGAPGY